MTGANGGNFNMATEDFPALGGNAAAQTTNGNTAGSSLLNNATTRANGNTNAGLYGVAGSNSNNSAPSSADDVVDTSGGLLGGAGLGGLGGLRGVSQQQQQQQQPLRTSSSGPATAPAAGSALGGDYGLLGLLGVIRMTDADRNALALGSDLTLLGLNLGSAEQIYNTFSSPWNDTAVSKEPHYQVRSIRDFERAYRPISNPSTTAPHVLLHATSSIKDGPLVKISARNTLLHLLCPSERRTAGICGARAILTGMEVPR
jgi:hypothetical protein